MSITKEQNDKMSRDLDKCCWSPDVIKEYNKEIILLKQQLKQRK